MNKFKIIVSTVLQVFGSLWIIVETISFFSNEASEKFKTFWWIFVIIGGLIILYRLYPKKRFQYKIKNRDIGIELVIGDIFKEKGSMIVGFNKGHIVDSDIIDINSIQGVFMKKYFNKNTDILHQISSDRKVNIGDTYTISAKDKTAYFCVISELNGNGIAKSSIEDIRMGLSFLWVYLRDNASKTIIDIPILGSGFSRVNQSREELLQEIVLSFLASLNEHTYCDGLRIVIYPSDIKKFNIDIEEIKNFIAYNCKYAISSNTRIGIGQGIS